MKVIREAVSSVVQCGVHSSGDLVISRDSVVSSMSSRTVKLINLARLGA